MGNPSRNTIKRMKARHPDLYASSKKAKYMQLTKNLIALESDLRQLIITGSNISNGSRQLSFVEINRPAWQNEYKPLV